MNHVGTKTAVYVPIAAPKQRNTSTRKDGPTTLTRGAGQQTTMLPNETRNYVGDPDLLACYLAFAETVKELDDRLSAMEEAGNIHAKGYRFYGVELRAWYSRDHHDDINRGEGVITQMEDTWAIVETFNTYEDR